MGRFKKNKPELRKSRSCSFLEMNGTTLKVDCEGITPDRIKLVEFRKVVQDILEPHHDDQFLLRWLKARDFDIVKAEKMIRESFKFRKKIGANTILNGIYEQPEVYRKYPISHSCGFSHDNSVVRVFLVGMCDYKGYVYSLKTIDILKLLVYELEKDLNKIWEKKKKGESVEEKTTFIMDFQGFSLKKFYDKSVINAGIQLITMYQDNYPETLKVAYIVNVPSYFNWIFNIFKPFLNAVTLAKLRIYKTDEWKEELRSTMCPKIIPAFLGGDLRDPDDNCTNLLYWDQKIPDQYYLKTHSRPSIVDPDLKFATIAQRGVLEVPVEVPVKGSVLKWTFCTKDYNVKFGLFLKQERGGRKEVIPVDSVDCQVIPEEGEHLCEKTGTYVLYFDNSYSWMTAKQLYYKVEVETPSDMIIETNNN